MAGPPVANRWPNRGKKRGVSMAKQSPLIECLERQLAQLGKANALEVMTLAKGTINLAAAIIRDHENRMVALEEWAERHAKNCPPKVPQL